MHILDLPYSEELLDLLRLQCGGYKGFVWIDSGQPWNDPALHPSELLLFWPDWQLHGNAENIQLTFDQSLSVLVERSDAWEQNDDLAYRAAIERYHSPPAFKGGLAGVLPYRNDCPGVDAPVVAFDYRNFVEIRHDRRTVTVVLTTDEYRKRFEGDLACHEPKRSALLPFKLANQLAWRWTRDDYQQAFNRVQDYLSAGDCYQVNLTQRCQAGFTGSPLHAYQALRGLARSPFSAYVPLSGGTDSDALLCFSPERFLAVENGIVTTSPIKGTSARQADAVLDQLAGQSLLASEKDRAENVMIVDLLRNDLSRYARSGSVQVPELFSLHSFEHVHHLISTIKAELLADVHPLELLAGCSPGGSITGAPKKRAMEIIRELEAAPRHYYCGSVFTYSRCGRLDSNIVIRSVQCMNGVAAIDGGGGITTGSTCDEEYAESVDKIRHLIEGLEAL